MVETVGAVLLVFSWIGVAILAFFLHLIGRLYEIKFKRRSNYRLFLVPLVLFLIAAVAYTVFPPGAERGFRFDFVGLIIPDILFLVAGLVLGASCYSLVRMMIAGKG